MNYTLLVKYQNQDKWIRLDLFDDLPINIVYNIKDIREPETTKSNYTKTFSIPATSANRAFFETIDQSGFYPNQFTPNLKVLAQLYSNEDILIDGYLQVNEIIREDDIEKQTYEITIYGEISSLFSRLNGLNFKDIDVSEYNHRLTSPNIKDSWSNKIVKNGSKIQSYIGDGYVYPMEYRGQSIVIGEERWNEQDFRPAFYVKTLWDKIFRKGNVSYTSDFLNSERFKRLIIPLAKDNIYLSDEQVKAKEFRVKRDDYKTTECPQLNGAVAGWSSWESFKFNVEVNDPANVFRDEKNFIPFGTFNGTLASNFLIRARYNVNAGANPWRIAPDTSNSGSFSIKVRVVETNPSTNSITNIFERIFEYKHFSGFVVGTTTYDTNQGILIEIPSVFKEGFVYNISYQALLRQGNFATKFINSVGQPLNGTITFEQAINSDLYFTLNNKFINIDDEIKMNTILPDMDLDKFITSINKMFNLFWTPNPNKQGDFIIEPKDVLYNNSANKILDWTDKADRGDIISIKPLDEINFKSYVFTYTEDKDKYNVLYKDKHNEVFGTRTIDIINDFKTDINEVKIEFSPTPLMIWNDYKAIPSFIEDDGAGLLKPIDVNVRILYWGGMVLKPTPQNIPVKSWYLMSKGVKYYESSTVYPYAGHLDNPYNPTFDLNWGIAKEYYHYPTTNTSYFTTNNLVNLYWLETINDIIKPDNHLLTCKAHLTPYDIYTFNIFDTIQMDNVFYRINKIDYEITSEIAEIELYKTISATNAKYNFNNVGSTYNIEGDIPKGENGTGVSNASFGISSNNTWSLPTPESIGFDISNPYTYNGFYDSEWANFDTLSKNMSLGTVEGINENIIISNINDSSFKNDFRNNYYPVNKGITIKGIDNNVSLDAYNVDILGDSNYIGNNSTNIKVLGNNNFVASDLSNVEIIGDNNYATLSNATYNNGVITTNGVSFTEGKLITGGGDIVGNPFSNSAPLIRGGADAVINLGGSKVISLISGGANNTLNNDY